jgi:hypothetical protein
MSDNIKTGFTQRHNEDGSVDSICLCCFQTVCTSHSEFSLAQSELAHHCSEEHLRHSEPTNKRLIQWPYPSS